MSESLREGAAIAPSGTGTGRIPVAGPSITELEVSYVTDAVRNAWYSRANEFNDRFERAFAAYVGRRYAMSLPSCTSALHLALMALGVGAGDEVIVPEISWIATSAPVSYVGATPVFADVDPVTWCLDVESFEALITPRTKAVIVVDLYGNMPAMGGLVDAAARHGVAVIEDSAEAIGSILEGRHAGSFGIASTFSFHGSKTLTTGEGGMLLTDDEAFYQRCLVLRDHGRHPGDRMFWNREVAQKYKMSSVQAALGLAQLERVEELVEQKRRIFHWFRDLLAGIPGLTMNPELEGGRNSYWMSTVLWDQRYPVDKDVMMGRLRDAGVDSRPFFHPLSALPAYAHLADSQVAAAQNPVAYSISARGINLPSALSLTLDDVRRAADAFLQALVTPSIP